MTKLSDLLAQHEKIKQQIVEASTEEVLELKSRLEAISSATGKSISDLLGLPKATSTKKSTTSKADTDKDQKYREWIINSIDQTHKIGGKDTVIHSKTRLTDNVRKYVDSLGA